MAAVGTRVPGVGEHPLAPDIRDTDSALSALAPLSRRWVFAALLAFVAGMAIFWPRVLLVVDEDRYVSQAVAFSRGGTTVAGSEIIVPPTRVRAISDYPPGTSLLQTPFVWIGGWRAASVLSVLALIVATILTMRWLRLNGMSEAFALVVPGFVGASFFARVGMSDVPSMALIVASLYLLWIASPAKRGTSLAAGFCAGLSLLFREPLVLLLAPFAVGALLRRAVAPWAFVAGGVLALALRLGLSAALFDDALYVRDPGYGFALANLLHTLPLYALVMLVLFPGGALLPFFYRGPRRAEVVSATALYVMLLLLYAYDPIRENGPQKGLMLSTRFIVPLLPLLALMAADVWPRWYARLSARAPAASRALAKTAAIGAIAVALLVHVLAHRQEESALTLVRAMYADTDARNAVITNSNATLKYFSPAYGPRRLVLRYGLDAGATADLSRRLGPLSLVLLNRTDSQAHRIESAENDSYIDALRQRCALRPRTDRDIDGWARLQIFDLERCG